MIHFEREERHTSQSLTYKQNIYVQYLQQQGFPTLDNHLIYCPYVTQTLR